MRWWIVLPLACLYIAGSIAFKPYLYEGYMTSLGYIRPSGALWSVFASILLIELCRIIPQNKILTFIGQNSIGFYFMCGALPIVFSLLAHKCISGTSVWGLLIVYLACMVISYLVMKILTNWVPWLFDLRLLKRQNS